MNLKRKQELNREFMNLLVVHSYGKALAIFATNHTEEEWVYIATQVELLLALGKAA